MGFREFTVENNKNTKCMLVVPAEDSLSHGIQGIGDGEDYLVNRNLMDEIVLIKTRDAINRAKRFAEERGVLVGISAGANLVAAENYIKNSNPQDIVVTILCDRGERYLSVK